MSAKTGRRTPLSLTGGTKQQQSTGNSHPKNDNKTNNQKTEQTLTAVVELKESGSKELTKKQQNAEKKQQQQPQNAEKKQQQQPQNAEKKQQQQPQNAEKKQQQQQAQNAEKKQQQQQPQNAAEISKKSENLEEKKVQNGVGKANGSAKDKQQNGSGENGTSNDNDKDKGKDKTEKSDKIEKSPLPKEERKEKELKKPKVIQKELEAEPSDKPAEKDAKLGGADKKKRESLKNDLTNEADKKPITTSPVETTSTNTGTDKKTTTPIKVTEKSVTPGKAAQKIVSTTPQKTITTAIDDVEMESLIVEQSPNRKVTGEQSAVAAANYIANNPVATSTPGKVQPNKKRPVVTAAATKSEVQLAMQTTVTPTYSQISGRRSIRPITDYTPSYFQSNMQFRESYRRINTELDVTSNTNTSLNVTVGSEIPNNSSFSFFGRGRKRDRTPPPQSTQSALELQIDLENSPPKRARLDMYGFLNAVASPISLLRSRFSKTSIQSSTPMRTNSQLATEDEAEVQNVSGISIEEEIHNGDTAAVATTDDDITVGNIADAEEIKKITPAKQDSLVKDINLKHVAENCEPEKGDVIDGEISDDDIKITETPIVGDFSAKNNKRCSIM